MNIIRENIKIVQIDTLIRLKVYHMIKTLWIKVGWRLSPETPKAEIESHSAPALSSYLLYNCAFLVLPCTKSSSRMTLPAKSKQLKVVYD